MTSAQIVRSVLEFERDYKGNNLIRLRKTKGSNKEEKDVRLLPNRLMQEDNAYELNRIFHMQGIDEHVAQSLLRTVFAARSPKGSAKDKVGKDPLAPGQLRASKASLAFQRYRIAAMIANLRIKTAPRCTDRERRLTVEERNAIFRMLVERNVSGDKTWGDVADKLGIARSELKGVGATTPDGEERVSSQPPSLVSVQCVYACPDKKLGKQLQRWWEEHGENEDREAMLAILSNSEDIDAVRENARFAEAIDFIDKLDDSELSKLDGIKLPAGRAACSEQTLRTLTDRMLSTEDDLHDARKHEYVVGDNWRSPQEPIGAPLGNPAVDRVVKLVNQRLFAYQKRWGNPRAIQIEHVRDGLASSAVGQQNKRAYEARVRRYTILNGNIEDILRKEGHGLASQSDIRRQIAITRQDGRCLYCGMGITFTTCEMDHIVPRAGIGSTNTRTNLAAVCSECNRLKSNTPFAVWCNSDKTKPGVSLTEAVQRVRNFNFVDSDLAGAEARHFKDEIIRRLKQKAEDEPIDNRSIESVAWMADELHRRIDWHFNSSKYTNEGAGGETESTCVAVFRGSVTGEARKASGIEKKIHFYGPSGKTRFDRRHHAVDAAVISLMSHDVAKTLAERSSLREAQWITGEPTAVPREFAGGAAERPFSMEWKEYAGADTQQRQKFDIWKSEMERLGELLNEAMDNDRVPVSRSVRLKIGSTAAHDATIRKLRYCLVGDAIPSDVIRKASTPALYCALTRLPDYDLEAGLPADPNRHIVVHGDRLDARSSIGFFASNAAQIAVQHGSAEVGNAIHHARIYHYYTETKTGRRTYAYGMVRVFQHDLMRERGNDVFSADLPEQAISMRYASPRVREAIALKRAEYIGYLVSGDELVFSNIDFSGGPFAKLLTVGGNMDRSVVRKWVVKGFSAPSKLRLGPSMLSGEGLSRIDRLQEDEALRNKLEELFGDSGWRVAVNEIGKFCPTTIRRNSFGEIRWISNNSMPTSWRWDPDDRER